MAVSPACTVHAARTLARDGVQLRHLLQDRTEVGAILPNHEERTRWLHLQWRARLALRG
jgi:hypothetical protein